VPKSVAPRAYNDDIVARRGYLFIDNLVDNKRVGRLCRAMDDCPIRRRISGGVAETIFYQDPRHVDSGKLPHWSGWASFLRTHLAPIIKSLGLENLSILQTTRLQVRRPAGRDSAWFRGGEQPPHKDFLFADGRVIILHLSATWESTHFYDRVARDRTLLRQAYKQYKGLNRMPTTAETGVILGKIFGPCKFSRF